MKLLTKLSFIALLFAVISCNSTPKTDTDTTVEDVSVDVPYDFIQFLDEFHTDEDFQLAHIRFPLQGAPSMIVDSIDTATFRWEADNWVMHKGFDPDNEEFVQTFKMFGDNMIAEHIIHINGKTGMERRFAKSGDSYDLIYYAAMNFIKQ